MVGIDKSSSGPVDNGLDVQAKNPDALSQYLAQSAELFENRNSETHKWTLATMLTSHAAGVYFLVEDGLPSATHDLAALGCFVIGILAIQFYAICYGKCAAYHARHAWFCFVHPERASEVFGRFDKRGILTAYASDKLKKLLCSSREFDLGARKLSFVFLKLSNLSLYSSYILFVAACSLVVFGLARQ